MLLASLILVSRGGANVNFAAKQANQLHYTPLAAAVVRGHSAALVQALCPLPSTQPRLIPR